jgi:phenylalanine ammonia-lyase
LCHAASDHSIDRHGESIVIDGHSLSIPALVAVARHNAQIALNDSPEIMAGIQKSRDVIVGKVETSQSVYGVSTGFGGSGKSTPPVSLFRLVTHQRVSLKPIPVRPTLWLSEVHYCSTSMQVSCPRPRMSSLLSLFSIPSRLRACQSLGFVERSSSESIL